MKNNIQYCTVNVNGIKFCFYSEVNNKMEEHYVQLQENIIYEVYLTIKHFVLRLYTYVYTLYIRKL
jgi:hypothetical protein